MLLFLCNFCVTFSLPQSKSSLKSFLQNQQPSILLLHKAHGVFYLSQMKLQEQHQAEQLFPLGYVSVIEFASSHSQLTVTAF